MTSWLPLVLRSLTGLARSHASLAAENAFFDTNSPYFSGSGPGRCSDRQTACSGFGLLGTGIGGARLWC